MMMPNLQAAAGSPNRLPMLTPAQLRAARALVGWSRQDLADGPTYRPRPSGTSGYDLETARRNGTQVAAGARGGRVAFLNEDDHAGAGVRWKKGWPKTKR